MSQITDQGIINHLTHRVLKLHEGTAVIIMRELRIIRVWDYCRDEHNYSFVVIVPLLGNNVKISCFDSFDDIPSVIQEVLKEKQSIKVTHNMIGAAQSN